MRLDDSNSQRYQGIGELNVQTARGEVKAHPGDLILDLSGEKLVLTPGQAQALLGGEIANFMTLDKTKSPREATDPQIVKHEGEAEALTTDEVSRRANNLAADGDLKGLDQLNRERGSRTPMIADLRQKRHFDTDQRKLVDAQRAVNEGENVRTVKVSTGEETEAQASGEVALKVNPDLLEAEKDKDKASIDTITGPGGEQDRAESEDQRRAREAAAASMPEATPMSERNQIPAREDPRKMEDLKTPTEGGPETRIPDAVREANRSPEVEKHPVPGAESPKAIGGPGNQQSNQGNAQSAGQQKAPPKDIW